MIPMKTFAEIVAGFERTRKYAGESDGFMSDRQTYTEFPNRDPDVLREINADRKTIKAIAAKIKPDETFEIPRTHTKAMSYPWKPARIDLYGITRAGIAAAVGDAIETHRTLRTASIHGASHSFAMLVYLLNERIPFDFANYINVPGEMAGEREFVLYYAVHLLKVPFVMVVPQDTAMEYYYRTRMLPTAIHRWCTNYMKIQPFARFAESEIYNRLLPGQHVDLVNFMGMQSHQSARRAKMSSGPTPARASIPSPTKRIRDPACTVHESGKYKGKPITIWVNNWPARSMAAWFKLKPDARVLRQFNMLPVFNLSEDDNRDLIENVGGIRNPNEREFASHGCLICPFKKIPYYLYLKEKYPAVFTEALALRDEGTLARREEGTLAKPFTQFTMKDVKKFNVIARSIGYPELDKIPF